MSSIVKKLLLIASAAAVLFYMVSFSLSAFYYGQAKKIDSTQLRSEVSLYDAISYLDKSLGFRSTNADALDLKAELLYKLWWIKADGAFLANSPLLKHSKTTHLEALAIRKNWPFTMAQLARIEAHNLVLSDDFYYWFAKAYNFGRYETTLALDLMKIGLFRWVELPESYQQKVIELTRISIEQKRNSTQEIQKLLLDKRLLKTVCSSMQLSARIMKVCGNDSTL